MASEFPQSQKNVVRTNTRKAWRDSACDAATACVIAHERNRRDVGAKWLDEANDLSDSLIGYWDANRVTEPASVFVAGEPGCQGWDE